MTGLLAECIMILKREKENGVLTEGARNDIAEFLSCACDQLFGADAELIREVHEIMEPAVKLRREIVEELRENIKDLRADNQDLQKSNKDLQESNKDLQKSNKDLQKNNKDLQKNNKDLQKNNKDLQESNKRLQNKNEELEKGLANLIRKFQTEGKSRGEVEEELRKLFSLTETDAGDYLKKYWKND